MKGLLDGNVVTSFIRSYNTNMDISKIKMEVIIKIILYKYNRMGV